MTQGTWPVKQDILKIWRDLCRPPCKQTQTCCWQGQLPKEAQMAMTETDPTVVREPNRMKVREDKVSQGGTSPRSTRPESFTGGSTKCWRPESSSALHKLLQSTDGDGEVPKCFYEARVILIHQVKKNKERKPWPVSFMNINAQILNKSLANRI